MKFLRGTGNNHMKLLNHWDCCFVSFRHTTIM
jgi:hypothetical protein